MISSDKKQKAKALVNEGELLVNQAEILLQKLVIRNARMSQEMKQIRIELEEKLISKTN
ncbi:hypothetical protein [Spirosoma terrae]|uniref:Uncharacterized protein n=1 Tax=Spirosoma terrae TaxID=1968276 RepID=A0A6L9LCS3_9BACT|nr:hypothetical protein [Spirosoma terrae]NDU96258.1 hypothetical protein [Spirosoma terrae]